MKSIDILFRFKIFLNAFRKDIMLLFDREYINRSLSKRKGHCSYTKCKAICCGPCEHLNKDYSCKIYTNRPYQCVTCYPVDAFELKYFGIEKDCTFYWDDE